MIVATNSQNLNYKVRLMKGVPGTSVSATIAQFVMHRALFQ